MNFLVFQPLKCHMLSNFKNMRTVMFENLLQMLNSRHTKLSTISNQFNPQLQNLYLFTLLLTLNTTTQMRSLHKF